MPRDTERTIVVATDEMAAVFAEWLRQYHEEPERFKEYAPPGLEQEYGDECVDTFLAIHEQLHGLLDPS